MTLANEWWDLTYEVWPDRQYQYDESTRDVWNTMLLPTVLLVLGNLWPGMTRSRNVTPDPAGDEKVLIE